MQQSGYDFVPSSFDPDDPDLRALPRPRGWEWDSCEIALKEFGTQGLMIRLPLFWQVVPAIHASCRKFGIPIFINDRSNMPLGAAALSHAGVDTVITEARDAISFAAFLTEHKLAFPKSWIVIHRATDAWDLPEAFAGNLAQEVHLSPGVVSLFQCPSLMREKKPLFHSSNSNDTDKAAFHLQEKGTCVCGLTTLARA